MGIGLLVAHGNGNCLLDFDDFPMNMNSRDFQAINLLLHDDGSSNKCSKNMDFTLYHSGGLWNAVASS